MDAREPSIKEKAVSEDAALSMPGGRAGSFGDAPQLAAEEPGILPKSPSSSVPDWNVGQEPKELHEDLKRKEEGE